jgi:hypothetical protein
MTRTQRILAALLALQVVLAAVVFWPRTSEVAASGPLFSELSVDDIVAVTIEDGEGDSSELVRQGNGWVLGGSGGYPADGEKITPVLAKIVAIQTNRLVARADESHRRLGVASDNFTRQIDMALNDGSVQTLLIGSAPSASGTHVRRGDRNETYLTGDIASWEVNAAPSNWIDASYTSINQQEVVSVKLENSSGSIQFEKDADDAWTMQGLGEDEVLAQSQVTALLSRISTMRLSEPLGVTAEEAYGLDDPQATVTVITEEGEELDRRIYTLLVGAQDPEDASFFVKWSRSDYYVKVAAFSVDNMVNRGREDFIEAPPTPEPGLAPEEAPTPSS